MGEGKRSNWEKKYHFLQLVYNVHQNLIAFADTKAACVLTLNFSILVFVAGRFKTAKPHLVNLESAIFGLLLGLVLLYCFVFIQSTISAISTISPRLDSGKFTPYAHQFLFALHVLNQPSSEVYFQELMDLTEEKTLGDYAYEVWGLSEILLMKFKAAQNSLYFMKFNLILALLLILFLEIIVP